jgi:uncharacterized protein YbbC (DUF1343 family)
MYAETVAPVLTGTDVFFEKQQWKSFKGKGVGLITNQTGVNRHLRSTVELFKSNAGEYRLCALFAPEHGINGAAHADKKIQHGKDEDGVPIYSLYGNTRRPTDDMLKGIDVLFYDIQDIGVRCYTYATTLFYVMEEAAKRKIKVIVLDRPNPINGVMVDGPMLDSKWRSFVGYINTPFCHGMTIGELARFFNEEYHIDCDLQIVKMSGWKRTMSFSETGLPWIPTSPQIPEAETTLYYPATVILGEALNAVNIGVGYTLPFRIIGAPWIDAKKLSTQLNAQKIAGIQFQPFYFQPFFGRYKGQACQGVRMVVTNHRIFRPVSAQFLIMGILKNLYPKEFSKGIDQTLARQRFFYQIAGSEEAYRIIHQEKYIAWKLIGLQKKEREEFLKTRKKYLLY